MDTGSVILSKDCENSGHFFAIQKSENHSEGRVRMEMSLHSCLSENIEGIAARKQMNHTRR